MANNSAISKSIANITNWIDKINERIGIVGGSTIIVLTILVMVFEIIARYIFNSPTRFSLEAAIMFQVLIAAFASGYVLKEEGHISIGFIVERVSERVRNWMLFASSIVGVFYCAILSSQVWNVAIWNLKIMKYSENMGIPITYIQFILFAGLVLLSLQFLARMYKYYRLANGIEKEG